MDNGNLLRRRPLRGWRYANAVHALTAFGFFLLPFLPTIYYTTIDPSIYHFAPERIGGYWRYTVDQDFWYLPLYNAQYPALSADSEFMLTGRYYSFPPQSAPADFAIDPPTS